MISDGIIPEDKNRIFRTLGICWVVYGIIRLAGAIWLVLYSSTATMMFGALLNRVPDPFTMMSSFHIIYSLFVAMSAVCSVLGILAGLALLGGQRLARTLALIAGFLALSGIPLGITLGIYTLIVLLPLRVTHMSAVVLDDRASELGGDPSTT